MKSDYNALVYYYSKNEFNYKYPIKNGRRVKVWTVKNVSLVTDIEFVLEDGFVLELGQFSLVNINAVNRVYLEELINSGYKVFFGETSDKRLGEIVGLLNV
jgi:hypothetical protein